ncbi:hypothetical protein [Nostoc sp. LEGE 12450]|uniref:hypothetical protein n=1 Tax=Nostoc sp. LEGE 12450 TaxID=1828643 RepID=UPI001880BCA0|nr:hypothetical protein [Nostoc sp. LEGE 12450]MBE8992465.1 hypothetical protein [Nostoc sp. LEGE 12450]
MLVHSLIVEQLNLDGTLKTFRMRSSPKYGEITVAFVDEYEEPREGPFYFLDKNYTQSYIEGFAECEARRLGKKYFRCLEASYEISISWYNISTKSNELSIYSLSLPKYAIPKRLHITDPHNCFHEFQRYLLKDEQNNCFIVYLLCKSRYGQFHFDLSCEFNIDTSNFDLADYKDDFTTDNPYKHRQDLLKYTLSAEEQVKVKDFLQPPTSVNCINYSTVNIQNSQIGGSLINAERVDAEQLGGNIYNNDA